MRRTPWVFYFRPPRRRSLLSASPDSPVRRVRQAEDGSIFSADFGLAVPCSSFFLSRTKIFVVVMVKMSFVFTFFDGGGEERRGARVGRYATDPSPPGRFPSLINSSRSRRNSLMTSANASGLTPCSIKRTHMASVSVSSPWVTMSQSIFVN